MAVCELERSTTNSFAHIVIEDPGLSLSGDPGPIGLLEASGGTSWCH